jgi:hypothetical protein
MATFSGSPKLLKGGLVLTDPLTAAVQRVIVLQYNPNTMTRTVQALATGSEGDRSQALRLRGAAVETYKMEATLDAIDQLEEDDRDAAELGIHPQLAALESLLHPSSGRLLSNDRLASSGSLEIVPMESPLLLFVWSKRRIVPVRLTELNVTEDAFDTALNPIRAKVGIGFRVLSVDDLGFEHRGGSLFINYLQQKEELAARAAPGLLGSLGIAGIP